MCLILGQSHIKFFFFVVLSAPHYEPIAEWGMFDLKGERRNKAATAKLVYKSNQPVQHGSFAVFFSSSL